MSDDSTKNKLNIDQCNQFKELFKECNNEELYRSKADILFSLAKQIPAEEITHAWNGLGYNYLHFACQLRPDHALELINRLSPEQIAQQSGYKRTPLHYALQATESYDATYGMKLMLRLIKKSNPLDLTKTNGEKKTDLELIRSSGLIRADRKTKIINAYLERLNYKEPENNNPPTVINNYPTANFNPMTAMQALLDNPNATQIDANKFAREQSTAVQTIIDDLATKQMAQITTRDTALAAVEKLKHRIEKMDEYLYSLTEHFDDLEPETISFIKNIMNQIFKKKPITPTDIIDFKAMRAVINEGRESAYKIIESCHAINTNPNLQIAPFAERDTAYAHGLKILAERGDGESLMFLVLQSKREDNKTDLTFVNDVFENMGRMEASATMTMLEMDKLDRDISYAATNIIAAATDINIAFQQARLRGESLPIAMQARLDDARAQIAEFQTAALGIESQLTEIKEVKPSTPRLEALEAR